MSPDLRQGLCLFSVWPFAVVLHESQPCLAEVYDSQKICSSDILRMNMRCPGCDPSGKENEGRTDWGNQKFDVWDVQRDIYQSVGNLQLAFRDVHIEVEDIQDDKHALN